MDYGVEFLRPAWRGKLTPQSVALPAMGVSCFVFHILVPNGPDLRYMMPVFAWLSVAAAEGAHWLVSRLPLPAFPRALAGFAGLLLLFCGTTFKLHHKQDSGARAAISEIHSRVAATKGPVVLVVSGDVEGAVIAEAARVDAHRRWIVYRGSKIAATSTWMGREYQMLVNTPAELRAKLDSIPVHFVLLENGNYWSLPHQDLFRRMLTEFPNHFRPLSPPSRIIAVQLDNPFVSCIHPLPIDMENTLGGSIGLSDASCRPDSTK